VVNVLIVEDDTATRQQLAERVEAAGGMRIQVGVGSLAGARAELLRQRPDVLLLDLELEDGHGKELIAELYARDRDLPILVISVFGDEQSVIDAIRAGARGYLLKDDDSAEIGFAISQLLAGGSPISPAIARHLVNQYQFAPGPQDNGVALSAREHEVLTLAAKGYTYQETAELLGVSVNTVSTYTRRIYGKLSVSSRSAAVFEARQSGLMRERP
jgi:DNA-binding NarL/FixJ family response regulator